MNKLTISELEAILEKAGYSDLNLKITPNEYLNDGIVTLTVEMYADKKEEQTNTFCIDNLQEILTILEPNDYLTNQISSICPNFNQHVRAITGYTAVKADCERRQMYQKYIGAALAAAYDLRDNESDLQEALEAMSKTFLNIDGLRKTVEKAREHKESYELLKDELRKEKLLKLKEFIETCKEELSDILSCHVK